MSNKQPEHIIEFTNIADAAIAIGKYLGGKAGSEVIDALDSLRYVANNLKDFSSFENKFRWLDAYLELFSNGFTKFKPHINVAQSVLVSLLDDKGMPIAVGFYDRHMNAGEDMGRAAIISKPGQKKGHGIIVYPECIGNQTITYRQGKRISIQEFDLDAKIHYSIHTTEELRLKMGKLPPKARGIVPANAVDLPRGILA